MVFPYSEAIGLAAPVEARAPEITEIIEIREPRAETASGWAARLQAQASLCGCGCGEQIRLRPDHRAPTRGIPRFLQGHHSNPLRRLHAAIHAKGLLLTGEICKELGISETQYHRLEKAGVFRSPERWGLRPLPRLRVFTPDHVRALRAALRTWRCSRRERTVRKKCR